MMIFLKKVHRLAYSVLASNYFLWFIVICFVLEALWIAFSFRFPMLYDEAFHVDAIKLFAGQLSPIITDQPQTYDQYGSLISGGATIFHYLMSFPYRIFSLTNNLAVTVVGLRVICILMVAVSLLLFNKLFRLIKIRQVYISVGMLVFILLPIVPFISATVNYDNLLLPLTVWFFIIVVRIIQSKDLSWIDIAKLIIVGCVASLAKLTFLPIFLASVIYITIFILRNYGSKTFRKIHQSFVATSRITSITLITLLVISIGLFSSIYIKNTILYGAPQPSCAKTLGEVRCSANSGAIRNKNAYDTRETRPLSQLPEFISSWTVQMENWTNMSGQRVPGIGSVVKNPLPIMFMTTFLLSFVGVGTLLYSWNRIKKTRGWYFLITISIVLIISIFIQNYVSYLEIHIAYGVQPRYLLSIAPIIIVMSVLALSVALRRRVLIKTTILFLVLMLFTQGGGIITHIVSSEESWNWNSEIVRTVNNGARNALRPLVKEH